MTDTPDDSMWEPHVSHRSSPRLRRWLSRLGFDVSTDGPTTDGSDTETLSSADGENADDADRRRR